MQEKSQIKRVPACCLQCADPQKCNAIFAEIRITKGFLGDRAERATFLFAGNPAKIYEPSQNPHGSLRQAAPTNGTPLC
jgi:hypothetical protein